MFPHKFCAVSTTATLNHYPLLDPGGWFPQYIAAAQNRHTAFKALCSSIFYHKLYDIPLAMVPESRDVSRHFPLWGGGQG